MLPPRAFPDLCEATKKHLYTTLPEEKKKACKRKKQHWDTVILLYAIQKNEYCLQDNCQNNPTLVINTLAISNTPAGTYVQSMKHPFQQLK
jgi:hypothetical protein